MIWRTRIKLQQGLISKKHVNICNNAVWVICPVFASFHLGCFVIAVTGPLGRGPVCQGSVSLKIFPSLFTFCGQLLKMYTLHVIGFTQEKTTLFICLRQKNRVLFRASRNKHLPIWTSTYGGLNKMAAILQKAFSNLFSWKNTLVQVW